MLLVVGGHVLGDRGPGCARMATGLAGGMGDTQQEMVHAPGGLGSCAVLVERAATILLELPAEAELRH